MSRSARPTKPRARARRSSRGFSMPRLPSVELEQHQLDVLGLGLVALAAFFAAVFYLGWSGGKVGEALAHGFVFLFGGVAYLIPMALFGAGALIVVGPMLPSIRPFRTGALLLLVALMLGLAAGTFGLGPANPPRHGFFQPLFFRHHGGAAGEALYWVASNLFSRFGAHILFVFLTLAGVLLLTGASIAGVVRATRMGMSETTRRVRESTGELAALVAGRVRPAPVPDDRRWAEPLDPERGRPAPPDGGPVVRATHVEAPALDTGEED